MHTEDLRPLMRCKPPGPNSLEMYRRLMAVESPAFTVQRQCESVLTEHNTGIVYAKSLGSNVWDMDGNRYVDLVAGFGALPFGHAPSAIVSAANQQGNTLGLALGDVYPSSVKIELCERLAGYYPLAGARVMLSLSGADAITTALKTTVLATGRERVVAFNGSYHGLSHGPLSACGFSDKLRTPFFAQLGIPVSFIEFPQNQADLSQCQQTLAGYLAAGDVGAVLFEPIQGRGGCRIPPAGFVKMLREECDKTSTVLIADEIWTGFGRTGQTLASISDGIFPDLICVGKALGAGWPISACIGRVEIMNAWGKYGGTAIHTGTHFGSPIACAAALAMLNRFESENISERAQSVGEEWIYQLRNAFQDDKSVNVRGAGLMVGIEIKSRPERAVLLKQELLRQGYITLTAGEKNEVLMLTPALIIEEVLLSGFVKTISLSMQRLLS